MWNLEVVITMITYYITCITLHVHHHLCEWRSVTGNLCFRSELITLYSHCLLALVVQDQDN